MTSPARKHFLAQIAQTAAHGEAVLADLDEYQQLLKRLYDDKAVLKSIASVADKVTAKAKMLPVYEDWARGWLDGGTAAQDDRIIPTYIIWNIDCGLIDFIMPFAEKALETKTLTASDEFMRSLEEIIVEQIGEQVAGGCEVSQESLDKLVGWAKEKDSDGLHKYNMPDQIRAKVLKAVAERIEDDDPQTALDMFRQALNYNAKIGVKKKIAALEKELASE